MMINHLCLIPVIVGETREKGPAVLETGERAFTSTSAICSRDRHTDSRKPPTGSFMIFMFYLFVGRNNKDPVGSSPLTSSVFLPYNLEPCYTDILRKRATKPLLKQKHRQKHLTWAKEKKNWTVAQWSKVLFSDESKFCISFGKSRSQSLEEEWRGTESMLLEVQCEVSTVSDDLGCHVICWCWSTVFSEVHSQRSHLPGHFRALRASFC